MLTLYNLKSIGYELEIPNEFLGCSLSHYNEFNNKIVNLCVELADFYKSREAYKKLKNTLINDENGEMMFLCFLYALYLEKQEYIKRDIPIETFYYTVSTFKECLENGYLTNGYYNFDFGEWNQRHACLRIFHIEQLEFELYEDDVDKVVALHIPPKADLSNASLNLTFKKAREFVKKYFPEFYDLRWTLYSWLIDPEMTKLLPEESRIKQFSKRFSIISRFDAVHEIYQWIFHAKPETKIEDLDENTSLQRLIKNNLLQGKQFGCGFGVLTKEVL